MSFDPFGYQEPTPPASGGPGGLPDSSGDARQLAQAKERVKLPAVFLIVVGVLNLLVGLLQVGGTVYIAIQPADAMRESTIERYEQLGKSIPFFQELAKEARKQQPDALKTQSVSVNGAMSLALLVASLLVIFGGVRMVQVRSYGLCILASIVASIPCISFTACCCAGEIVGVWSLVVLLSTDVRMVFR